MKIIGGASRSTWVEQRRSILVDVINEEPTKNWSVREIALAMQLHPVVSSIQPSYSKSTAHLDWLAIKGELKEKREQLASEYIDYQLRVTNGLLEDLESKYYERAAVEADIDEIEDPFMRAQARIALMNSQRGLINAMETVMRRQSRLVPIDVPKQVQVDSRHVHLDIETFLQIRERVNSQLLSEGEVIEGELVDGESE